MLGLKRRMLMIREISLQTHGRNEMLDITVQVQRALAQENIQEGLAVVYCPHTTAGITINENADPDVVRDILRRLDEVYPWHNPQDRHMEGNTAAHLKASTIGPSQTVLIHNGQLLLGRWQGIYFCEFDGPRHRTCYIKFVKEN